MIRKVLLAVATGTLVLAALPGEAAFGDRLRARMARQMDGGATQEKATDGKIFSYGSAPLHTLAFWSPRQKGAAPAPLILFVHGGGWSRGDKDNATGQTKVTHFTGKGYALASINYRLVPQATVEQQASDVAASLAWTIAHARELGIDPQRIVLMGHSAGAHLVALVGTDPRYLTAAGLRADTPAGIIPLDGAAYEVPHQMANGPRIMQSTYRQAFGTDPARQRSLSPTLQAASPNAPAFLILHVQREDGIEQARALADALRKAGTAVQINDFPGEGLKGHMEINRMLGLPDYPATAVVDRWLAARFAS